MAELVFRHWMTFPAIPVGDTHRAAILRNSDKRRSRVTRHTLAFLKNSQI
jgi:hypothetical protein